MTPIVRPLPKPSSPDPSALYVNSLPSPRSRSRMTTAIQTLARTALALPAAIAALGIDPARVPWASLGAEGVTTLVRRLDAMHPSSQRVHVACLRGILRHAGADAGVIARAKASTATRVPAGRALSMGDLRKLKRAASGNLRDAALLVLLADGGLRVSEAVGVDASDWDGTSLRVLGKGNHERRTPFMPEHALVIETWLAGRREGPLLTSWKGQRAGARMTVRGVQLLLAGLARRAGIGRLSPHNLRRTCLSIGAQAGVAPQHLQALAGHKHLSTTQIYFRVPLLELSTTAARRKLEFMREHARAEAQREAACEAV
jgi:site-specific recombinase XerC